VRSTLVVWLVTNAAAVTLAATLSMATSQAGAQTVEKQSHSSVATAFDKAMRDWMTEQKVSRASAAVMRNGRLVFAAGYGGRGANDRVAVWSLSKAITAVCAASLLREGRWHFDDPIGPLLAPTFRRFGEPADERLRQITVAQLITHRSGIPRAAFAGDNLFAPGLTELLRQLPSREVTVDMLMPRILKVPLARDPGAEFEYTNMGYLLLGQIIEALTGKSYEAACGERVLARAGIKHPSLDREWGGIFQAAGGWELSGPEYLGFARVLQSTESGMMGPEEFDFLRSAAAKWINPERTIAYSLGVFVQPVVGGALQNIFHAGGHNWGQNDAADGAIDVNLGSSFVLASDGTAWFASYEGLNAGTHPQATSELDRAFFRARDSILEWPERDEFAAMGVGPIATAR
jgi:CubicO group peptidase (beta-lactamase class C family)